MLKAKHAKLVTTTFMGLTIQVPQDSKYIFLRKTRNKAYIVVSNEKPTFDGNNYQVTDSTIITEVDVDGITSETVKESLCFGAKLAPENEIDKDAIFLEAVSEAAELLDAVVTKLEEAYVKHSDNPEFLFRNVYHPSKGLFAQALNQANKISDTTIDAVTVSKGTKEDTSEEITPEDFMKILMAAAATRS